MGSYISKSYCKNNYNVEVNCTFVFNATRKEDNHAGGYRYGELPADGDVAGIGVIAMFITVTGLALSLSALDVFIRFHRSCCQTSRKAKRRQSIREETEQFDALSVIEAIVLSCSDQQVFTGGAYALALRFWKGCSITAYHYSIVNTILLLSCATHLMSIAVVRNYWRYPYLALLRTIAIAGLFVTTGILLASMNNVVDEELVFPNIIPGPREQNGLQLMPAACFQGGTGLMQDTMKLSFSKEHSRETFLFSTPKNTLEGWNFYLITLLWYMVALLMEAVRFVRRNNLLWGAEMSWTKRLRLDEKWLQRVVRGADSLYGLYVFGCVATGGIMVGFEANYMLSLRRWVAGTGWLEKNELSLTEEDDWSSFGQLLPMFLGLLTLFTFAQAMSDMYANRTKNQPHQGDEAQIGSSNSRYTPMSMEQLSSCGAAGGGTQISGRYSQVSLPSQHSIPRQQQPQRMSQYSQPMNRPHLNPQDTRDSSAPLIGSPPMESPYTPSPAETITPSFPVTTHGPDTSPFMTYFPSDWQHQASDQEQRTRVSSIPRRPVGSTSPVQARQQSFA